MGSKIQCPERLLPRVHGRSGRPGPFLAGGGVRSANKKFINKRMERRLMILPVIMEAQGGMCPQNRGK